MNYPSAPLVACVWLRSLGLPADDIGTDLPGEPSTWATNGYLQVPTAVGGSPAIHVAMRAPTVQVSAWTNRPDSQRAPWNRAEHLLGAVIDAAHDQAASIDLDMPAGFYPVRLHSVWCQSEPRRIPGDPAGYAHVNADFEMRWVVLR